MRARSTTETNIKREKPKSASRRSRTVAAAVLVAVICQFASGYGMPWLIGLFSDKS